MTVLTIARLTVLEASRRKVIWALAALTAVLLGLNGWGFSQIPGMHTNQVGQLTSGEAQIVASMLLNLVMFTMSLIVALGTAFLAGPTLAGELESGVALSMLARPVRRADVLLGKWLGLCAFAAGYVLIAGSSEFLIVRLTADYTPPQPVWGLVLLTLESIVLLSLALLLSSALSPMASGVVAVGVFGATWVAGVIGSIGQAVGNHEVAQVGAISRIVLPTDGLWHAVMNALQAPSVLSGGTGQVANPFLGADSLTPAYLIWVLVWLALVLALTVTAFSRRDI